jgi:death-on-curing protein
LIGALQSSVAQPYATYSSQDLYPTIIDKTAALGYSLIMNHPFVDGNKRVGHAAMAVFLRLNGRQIDAGVDEQEQLILGVAAGTIGRETFNDWVNDHAVPLR